MEESAPQLPLANPLPVSVSSLPLPTGGATSALQTTGNTSVASIDTKTPTLGQALAANSVPVILPSATIATLTPPAAITNYANETGGNLASIVTNTSRIAALGQAVMSASAPVVIASNQSAVPVSGTFWQTTQPVSGTFWQATQPISASSLPLPTGAATSAKQPALGTAGTPATDVLTVQGAASMTAIKTDGSATTQPVSATALPLPTGASTSALQSTGNTSLSSIDGKVPALGQALAASSVPVILPAATVTTLTPPAAITNYANETGGNLAAIKTDVDKIPSQGQALAAASMPVVLTAAQITTLTPPSAITGYALDATLTGGSAQVQGNVASASTDSGNPIKVGARFNSTLPTYTNGQRTDLQATANGSLQTNLNYLLAGEDQANNVMVTRVAGGLMPLNTSLINYSAQISTNTTTTPTAATAYISSIVISVTAAGTTSTLSIKDKQGTPLTLVNALGTASLSVGDNIFNFQTPIKMVSGIDIVTAGSVAATASVFINYYQ